MMMGNISKRNQLSPEWGVKVNPNKQCWLVSGRHCHVCLHHSHQIVHGIYVSQTPEPKHVQLFCMSQSPITKENWMRVIWCRWQMRHLCSLQAAQTLMERQVLGAAVEEFLDGFLWPRKWLNCIANVVSLWHLAVKLNNAQSSESPDQSETLRSVLWDCKLWSKVRLQQTLIIIIITLLCYQLICQLLFGLIDES